MKKSKLVLTASIVALMGMTLTTSCKKNNSSLDPTEKKCDPGYEGTNCDMQIRTPLIGTYNATDVDVISGDTTIYNSVISTNATVTVINISNLGDFVDPELVTANISKSGDMINFTIPAQKPEGSYSISGSGQFNTSTKKLTIQYGYSWMGSVPEAHSGTWILQ